MDFTWDWRAGDQEVVIFRLYDEAGAPISLTGTITSQVRTERREDSRKVADIAVSVTTGTDEDTGLTVDQLTLTATAAQTREAGRLGRRFFIDVQQDLGGVPTTILPTFQVAVSKGVTE